MSHHRPDRAVPARGDILNAPTAQQLSGHLKLLFGGEKFSTPDLRVFHAAIERETVGNRLRTAALDREKKDVDEFLDRYIDCRENEIVESERRLDFIIDQFSSGAHEDRKGHERRGRLGSAESQLTSASDVSHGSHSHTTQHAKKPQHPSHRSRGDKKPPEEPTGLDPATYTRHVHELREAKMRVTALIAKERDDSLTPHRRVMSARQPPVAKRPANALDSLLDMSREDALVAAEVRVYCMQ
jgi:hypothetical protein